MDLFNFDLTPEYVDRYAGVSNYDKFRKMTTKANVKMAIEKFAPFSKAKRSVGGVGTILSVDGTNIDNTDTSRGIVLSCDSNKGKNKKIVINNDALSSQLEDIHVDKHSEFFESQLRLAYGSFSNLTRSASFVGDFTEFVKDGEMSEEYLQLIDDVHQMAKARVMGYMPDYSSFRKNKLDNVVDGSGLDLVAQDLYCGTSDTNVAKLIDISKKTSSEWVDIEEMIESCIEDDIRSYSSKSVEFTEDLMPRLKVYDSGAKKPEGDKDGKEVCNAANGTVSYDESPSFSEQPTSRDHQWELNNDTLEADGKSQHDDKYFFNRREYKKETMSVEKYDHLVDALYESLIGRQGKKNSQSPSKKLNKRNVSSDLSENIYVSSDPIGGKKLNINVIIDTSGSMSGHYIDDAVYILYVFNELARRGVVSGKIMLSSSGCSGMWDFPMNLEMLKSIAAHNSGEGFRHTMAIRWAEMKAADFNVAITDGQLTDGHIDLAEFERNDIFVTGMYVRRGMDKSSITKYTGGLRKWFSHSIVRSSVEEAVYSIADQAILQLGSGHGN